MFSGAKLQKIRALRPNFHVSSDEPSSRGSGEGEVEVGGEGFDGGVGVEQVGEDLAFGPGLGRAFAFVDGYFDGHAVVAKQLWIWSSRAGMASRMVASCGWLSTTTM